jgi:hypothetical protein
VILRFRQSPISKPNSKLESAATIFVLFVVCNLSTFALAQQRQECIPGLDLGCALPPSGVMGDLCKDEKQYKSTNGDVSVSVQFRNATGGFVNTYWLDYTGQRQFYNRVAPGSAIGYVTFVTHPWVITDLDNRCVMLYLPTTNENQIVSVVQPKK